MEFARSDGFDLVNDMLPVNSAHTISTRDAARQSGLMFRPGESITAVEVVGHNGIIA